MTLLISLFPAYTRRALTEFEQIVDAVREWSDLNSLINNEGIVLGNSFLSPNNLRSPRAEFETNRVGY